ncbi:superoxide dismutase family protein [Rhodobacteraceae bacterium RKSG542]|uniref:superoxide dismutase family protein n=1 Tax=Pseudovibrio flavus TaxID=2529854 RepID=UPI0012BB655B|nr:superoxide dismutase family protein [Pseudovibrio flavus]MTI18352.1 superoxide dismutase family protein [Pseudovibrio flavus]
MRSLILAAGFIVLATGAMAQSKATAELKDTSGNVVGTLTLTDTPSETVLITGELSGLPEGVHGFHIHEYGRCEPNFDAAGGHFAPDGHDHGVMALHGPHGGDLPNLHVSADGKAVVEIFSEEIEVKPGDDESVLGGQGTAFIIHADPDDYTSQPTGNAGGRIACGVITPAS